MATFYLIVSRYHAKPKSLETGNVVRGEAIYSENCASCHGYKLEGQPNWRVATESGIYPAPPHDDTGHTWHHDDLTLFNYTKFGGADAMSQVGIDSFNSGMPAFSEELSDEDIWNVLSYIRSTWSVKNQLVQDQRNAGS